MNLKQYIEQIENGGSIKEIYEHYKQKAKNDSFNAFIRLNDFDINEEELKKTFLKWAVIWVKDNFLTKGYITSCASKMLENYISPYSSTVYENMVKNGWIMLWKTNMDEFAMGSSTETSYFGPTKNPVDDTKVPWWSSWGSAAAVAWDLCLAALWTDTWWSIRQPASLCWVVWFKPTYGTNSRYGIIAMASSLDQAWTFTKTVEDAVILSKSIASYDENDATSIERKDIENWEESLKKEDIKWMKIAVPQEFLWEWIQGWVKTSILDAIKKTKELWAKVEEVSMSLLKHALEAYYIIMSAEVSTNLSRFDGIKYGYGENSFDFSSIEEYYTSVRKWGFGQEVKRRILMWTYVLSAGAYEKYYGKAQKVRRLIKNEYDRIFKDYDLILWPTSPVTAWNIWEKTNDPLKMYLADIYTVPINLAWLPAMSLPVKKAEDTNLPVWLHIIADQFKEDKIFQFANVLEKTMK